MKTKHENLHRWLMVVVYAIAMAWVESAVVYYLRTHIARVEPYQANPLPVIGGFGPVELVRELATLIMLFTVGLLAGRTWRARFGYTVVAFGVSWLVKGGGPLCRATAIPISPAREYNSADSGSMLITGLPSRFFVIGFIRAELTCSPSPLNSIRRKLRINQIYPLAKIKMSPTESATVNLNIFIYPPPKTLAQVTII